tara:strand:- start:480 stop:1409 length:930 start_codon:yes stop_codon:yes gene_type:complete
MDLASLIGIIAGVSLIGGAILSKGEIQNFVNVPGMMIVFGGTIAATLLTFQFKDVVAAFRAALFVFSHEKEDSNNLVQTMVKLSILTRRKGIKELHNVKTKSRFLRKACNLIGDCSSEDVITSTLRTEIETMEMRHFIIQDVFKKMGAYSPAFGLLGTLIGLIQMMANLDNPSVLGKGMAVALLTTFYGSLMATLFFLPIAGKLKSRTVTQVLNLEIIFLGAISILDNNNPITIYEKLSSYIPAKSRKSIKIPRFPTSRTNNRDTEQESSNQKEATKNIDAEQSERDNLKETKKITQKNRSSEFVLEKK